MKKIFWLIIFILLTEASFAQIAEINTTSSIAYKGRLSAEERQKAIGQALERSLDNFVANLGQSSYSNIYEKNRDKIIENINEYVLSYSVIFENQDKRNKMFSVTLKTSINQPKLENFITSKLDTNIFPNAKEPITFFFYAREPEIIEIFDDKITKNTSTTSLERSLSENKIRGNNTETLVDDTFSVLEDSISNNATKNSQETNSVSDGITTRIATNMKYRVSSSREFNSAITSKLASSGYEVIDGDFIEGLSGSRISNEEIRREFSESENLDSKTLLEMANVLNELDIKYLAVGYMDFSEKQVDPISGKSKYSVSVVSTLYDVSRRFPTTISSVGPVSISGIGGDDMTAKNNAIVEASALVSNELAQQLSLKNVK